jgi:hypothetical protein
MSVKRRLLLHREVDFFKLEEQHNAEFFDSEGKLWHRDRPA